MVSALGISADSLGSACYGCPFNALFSGRSHRLTSTLINKSLSFSPVKTSQKSAPFQGEAKSEPLSGSLQTGLRLLWPPLPATPSPFLAVRIPLWVGGIGLTQLTVKRDTNRLGWRLSPGGNAGVAASHVLWQSAPRTFWLQLVSLFSCSLLTRCTTLHVRSPFRLFPRPLPL